MSFFFLSQTVQKRGAAVIAARKLSSAMSAANAACDHMRNWWFGTSEVCKRCWVKVFKWELEIAYFVLGKGRFHALIDKTIDTGNMMKI